VLVIGPSWVGDMVMAQSLLITLREDQRVGAIDVLAPAWSAPLIRRMPQVRAAIELPVTHGELALRRRWSLGRELHARRYGRALVLPRSFKSALVPFFARIPERVGYRGEMRYGLLTQVRALDEHLLTQTVQRFVALGLAPGAALPPAVPEPRLAVDPDHQRRLLAQLGLAPAPGLLGMMPGAEYGPAKCWPIERYAELAARITAAGRPLWIFGSDKDAASGAQIAAACASGAVNLCGKTQLEDVVDLLALTSAVVTNDSGLMHVAAAVGTHVIAIYGSSTPHYTPPLTARATVLYRGLSCSPCFARECPLGHFRCMLDIEVDEVAAAVERAGALAGVAQTR
jgi:lipopolysaccharide heptosyltransferase II